MIKHKLNNSGFGVQFSPFKNNIIAACCSQNFGIVGNGSISVIITNKYILTTNQITYNVIRTIFNSDKQLKSQYKSYGI